RADDRHELAVGHTKAYVRDRQVRPVRPGQAGYLKHRAPFSHCQFEKCGTAKAAIARGLSRRCAIDCIDELTSITVHNHRCAPLAAPRMDNTEGLCSPVLTNHERPG